MASGEVDKLTAQMAGTSVDSQAGLSFAGRGIKMDSEEHAKEIIDAMNACKELRWLRLEGNTLGPEAAKAIAKALEKHPELQRALWSDVFTGRLKTEIPGALRYLGNGIILAGAKLVELDLSDNAFGPNGMEGLVDFLKSSSCYSLRELKLNNNGLGITGGKMLAKSLLECHKKSVADGTPLALRVFVSGRGRLENEGSMHLAEAFKAMGSLEEVSMPQNGIFHEGIMALAEAFACNTKLKKLDLSDNIFTEVGARAMAKALPMLKELEVMNFGDCLIKTGGVKAIAKVMENSNPNLREVVLSFNEIKTPGAVALTQSLKNKQCLEKLDLNGNQLGEEGQSMVREIVEDSGKDENILASFSDDEGTDDEDEEEEASDQEEDEGIEIKDPELEIHGVGLTPRSSENGTITVEEFLRRPSAASLMSLGPTRAELFSSHVYKDDVSEVVKTVMQLSSVVNQDDEKVKAAACECSDVLLDEMLSSGDDSTKAGLANEILVYLGLMKSEDKKFQPPADLSGPLIVLENAAKQQYFPKMTKDILQVFVGKPNAKLDSQGQHKHRLLQALFQ